MTATTHRSARRMAAVAARRLAVDRNALWSWPERTRVWLTIAAGVLVLATAPFVARPVIAAAYRNAANEVRVQGVHRHRVPAVLLQDAHPLTSAFDATNPVRVKARWTGPDGRTYRRSIDVNRKAPAGSTVAIWVDDHGLPAPAPLTLSQANGQAAAMGVAAGFATLAVIGFPTWLFRRWADRRGYARLELQWAVLAPQWTRKY